MLGKKKKDVFSSTWTVETTASGDHGSLTSRGINDAPFGNGVSHQPHRNGISVSGGGVGGPPGDGEKKRNDLTTAVTVQTVSKKVDSRGGGGDPGGMSGCCSNLARRACTKKQLQKKLPILSWLPRYTGNFAISDIIAGVTVGLTVIPQGIAYALVAKLPAQYGLYSAFMGCFMYIFFGTSKDVTVGPTAIMALMTAEHANGDPNDPNKGPTYVILLTFLSGLVIMAFGILRLGVVIDFISVPVIAGFTSAAAITIASSQVKSVFGLEITHHAHWGGEGILKTWAEIVENFDSMRTADTILGLVCIVILLLMRAAKNVTWFETPEDGDEASGCQSFCGRLPSTLRAFVSKIVWLSSTARNAVVVVACALIAYGFDPVLPSSSCQQSDGHLKELCIKASSRNTTFILTGDIQSGLPPFKPPPFSYSFNETTYVGFGEMVSDLGSALIIIPLIAILENIAIAKAFAGGKQLDANQEMIALGICNFMGSFVSSMPVTGSFSRTAVNCASGVKTPLGGIYTGALVLLALGLLMPFCAYIPKASLAAVIITAVIFSVEYEVVRPMWKSKKVDLIPAFATFVCCLIWALEYGILVGVGIQVLFILYNAARPSVVVQVESLNSGSSYLWVSPDRALTFPSINYVRNVINKAATRPPCNPSIPVVLDCSHISSADFTAAKGFKAMISDFKMRGQELIFYNTHESVLDTFVGANVEFNVVHSIAELHECLNVVLHRDPETAQPVMIGNIQFNGGGLFESGGDAIHNEDSDHHQNLFTSHS